MISIITNVLRVFLAVCTSLLIFEEMHVFLLQKPTSTHMEIQQMKASLFPETLICQTPGYDIDAIQRNGYRSSFWYTVGQNNSGHFIGWGGEFKKESTNLIDKLVWLKNASDPPRVLLKLRHQDKYNFQRITLPFSRVFYPLGRCFVVTVPKDAWKKTVVGLLLIGKTLNTSESSVAKNYRLFFQDTSNNARLLLPPFQMIGDDVKTHAQKIGYQQFRTRIKHTIHVENDPNFDCKFYDIKNSYENCLEEELRRSIYPYLGCYPPWLTDNETDWCKGIIVKNKSETDKIQLILNNVIDKNYQSRSCPQSCTRVIYETKYMDFDERKLKYGMFIQFEDIVELKKSSFVIDAQTLLARIGGSIGVGKEFFWVFIFLVGILKKATDYFQKNKQMTNDLLQ
jgi:hypothetical protein